MLFAEAVTLMFFCCRSTMSELFMECVEEELEPWQKQVPEVHLIEDDDDEPIFVGVLCTLHHIFRNIKRSYFIVKTLMAQINV